MNASKRTIDYYQPVPETTVKAAMRKKSQDIRTLEEDAHRKVIRDGIINYLGSNDSLRTYVEEQDAISGSLKDDIEAQVRFNELDIKIYHELLKSPDFQVNISKIDREVDDKYYQLQLLLSLSS